MNSQKPVLSIISPCYNEEELIIETMDTLSGLLLSMVEDKIISEESFIVLIDDGSKDKSLRLMKENRNDTIRIIKLASNKGHQNALLAGLHYVTGKVDCVISIDADLQDDLDVIPKMIDKFKSGYQIVCGVREDRNSDSLFKKKSAKVFYWLMRKMGVSLIENHADFRLLSASALNELNKYKESNLFLRGLFPLINLNLATIEYTQRKRQKGYTKYSLFKMLSLAVKGVTSFSIRPIRFITFIGFLFFIVTMGLSVHVLIVYAKGDVVPGWASITLPMYFLGGIQLLAIGIIGEYVGKIYNETKRRPMYHIDEIVE